MLFITALKRSCGKVMFLHLSVILFTGGGCLPLDPGVYIPLADTPLGRHPAKQTALGRHSSGKTPPPSAPSIEMTIEAAGMRPAGMHSCREHTLNCLVILLAQRNPIAYQAIVGLKDKKIRSPIPLALTFPVDFF